MARYIRCPKCWSTQLYVLQDNRNDFYAGLGGWLLTRSLFGAYMFANSQKSVFQCADCGRVFKKVW